MKVIYVHEYFFPDIERSIFNSFAKVYENWFKYGKDDLNGQEICVVSTFEDYYISNKVNMKTTTKPFIEKTDKTLYEKPVYKINNRMSPECYPINIKENCSSICCANTTINLCLWGIIDKDPIILENKCRIFTDTLLEIGQNKYGKERVTEIIKRNRDSAGIRWDILFDNKKISGTDILKYKNRFVVQSAFQNKWNDEIEKNVYYLMEGDRSWDKSHGKNEGITGLNIDLQEFIRILQKNINKYWNNGFTICNNNNLKIV